jgi:hypothetical protein
MHEGVLDGVFREVRIPEDEPGDREEAVGRGRREDLKGLVVAAPCRLDEIALADRSACRRGLGDRASTLHDGR